MPKTLQTKRKTCFGGPRMILYGFWKTHFLKKGLKTQFFLMLPFVCFWSKGAPGNNHYSPPSHRILLQEFVLSWISLASQNADNLFGSLKMECITNDVLSIEYQRHSFTSYTLPNQVCHQCLHVLLVCSTCATHFQHLFVCFLFHFVVCLLHLFVCLFAAFFLYLSLCL